MAKITVKQVRSQIKCPLRQKRVLEALGLKRIGQVVEHENSASILGMVNKLVELIAMNDRLRVLRLLASQMTSTSEASLLSPMGTQHPVLLSLTAFDAGGIRLTCVVVTDLRERVAAMAALQASETKFRLMAESVADCIFWVGADERFKYLSPACQRLSGYAPEEFLADPGLMLRIIHPDDRARYLAHIEHDLADACETEYRIVRRDGELRWIGHYCRPIPGEDGRDLGRRGTNRDITDRKELEQQVRRLRREVEQSRESVVADRSSPEIRSPSTLVLALVHRLRAALAPQQGLSLDATSRSLAPPRASPPRRWT